MKTRLALPFQIALLLLLLAPGVLLMLSPGLIAQENEQPYFFVQVADPQFGFFSGRSDSFEQETVNFEFTIASINRLHPAFVVAAGDLINNDGNPAQVAEYQRIISKLDPSIRLYNAPGNHDIGNEPSPEQLALYRQNFGSDYYSFRYQDFYGIVVNSSLIAAPGKVQEDADKQEAWLTTELEKAKVSGAKHIVLFQHYPYFLQQPDEPDQYFNLPLERRTRILKKLKDAGVSHVFAGHLHRNSGGTDGNLEMVTTGPVGRPLGADPSGMRIVTVRSTGITHTYYGLGSIPVTLQSNARRGGAARGGP